MALSIGKRFESNIAKSAPDYALVCRLPDSAQAFGSSSRLRFSRKNPFDYLIWDSKRFRLYAIELKTVKGKTISFERSEEDTGEIHLHQIDGLNEWNLYDGIICGFLIEFRENEETIFLKIEDFNDLLSEIDKKSFGKKDLDLYGISYFIVPQKKIRVNYRYDIDSLLSNYSLSEEKNNDD